MKNIHFYKYHGTGNDFIIVDDRNLSFPEDADQIKLMCDRRFGIGADGLILLRKSLGHDYRMDYFNADGHAGSMCGNGARCAFDLAVSMGICGSSAKFEAYDGLHTAERTEDGLIAVSMRSTGEIGSDGDAYLLDTGSPHYVLFTKDLKDLDVVTRGREIRNRKPYLAEGINVNFVRIGDGALDVRTYERGVENETYSCGTGAAAVALAFAHMRDMMFGPVHLFVLGGELFVDFRKNENSYTDIRLIGTATQVFQGDWRLDNGIKS